LKNGTNKTPHLECLATPNQARFHTNSLML